MGIVGGRQSITLQDPNCVNVMILYITDVDRGWGLLEEDKVLHYKILTVNVMILYITDVDRGWGLLEEDKVLHYKILTVLML